MITFIFFTITYILRPVGGYILGIVADKYGRVISFKISVTLMILGTLAIACSPSYHSLGSISIALLALARMAQAFSMRLECLFKNAFKLVI